MDLPEARMTSSSRLLWVTDPWETLDHPRDTTLRLIEEAVHMGVESHWAGAHSIRWDGKATSLDTYEVTAIAPGRTAQSFRLVNRGPRTASSFDCILYRPDPPVDLAYVHPLQLLLLDINGVAPEAPRCRIVNSPSVLLGQSEKLVGGVLSCRMPPTMVASQWDVLCAFGEREGRAIAKPIHQCQSKDVELLSFRNSVSRDRSHLVLERLTCGFTRPAVLQRFLPEVADGETRIWFLDGAVLGVVRKKAADGSYRIDMDKGGTLVAHTLTPHERSAVPSIEHWLRENDVRLAAVDLIDGWITDFNFTSPGLIPHMETVTGRNLAAPIVEALAASGSRSEVGLAAARHDLRCDGRGVEKPGPLEHRPV